MKTISMMTVVVSVMAASAAADVYVEYKAMNTTLDITAGISPTLTITENPFSDLMVWHGYDGAILDAVRISGGGAFDVAFSVQLTDLPGEDNWSASGTLALTDAELDGNVVEANFQSERIWITDGALRIDGKLQAVGGADDSILKPDGEPWVFVGQQPYSAADADGMPDRVTIFDQAVFARGGLFSTQFGVPTGSLDELFGLARTLEGGEIHGTVVPLPGAIVLGGIGLVLVGFFSRKYVF